MKCNHIMCPYNLALWEECSKELNPEKPCLYPEKYKNYRVSSLDRLLNFLDDLRILPALIYYKVSRCFKRS